MNEPLLPLVTTATDCRAKWFVLAPSPDFLNNRGDERRDSTPPSRATRRRQPSLILCLVTSSMLDLKIELIYNPHIWQ